MKNVLMLSVCCAWLAIDLWLAANDGAHSAIICGPSRSRRDLGYVIRHC